MTYHTPLKAAACALLALTPLVAQDRPVAIINARVVTMDGKPLDSGTVLLRGGVIDKVGADVDVPAGAEVIDAAGGTLMPGLVSAFSRAGLGSARSAAPPTTRRFRGRFRPGGSRGRSGGSASNKAAQKVADQLYARQDIYSDLLECGVTTLALAPSGAGFPGRGAVVDPSGKTAAEMTLDDAAFVLVSPASGSKNKKVIKDALEAAAKVVAERKKPKAAPKKPDPKTKAADTKKEGDAKAEGDAKKKAAGGETPPKEEVPPKKEPPKDGAAKKAEGDKEPAKPTAKKPTKKDPNIEVLADLLMGKTRGLLQVSSANQLAHFLDSAGDHRFPKAAFIAQGGSSTEGRLDEVLDKLTPWKAPILIAPQLTTATFGREVINPATLFRAAGLEVGFVLSDSKSELRGLFYNLMELVRHGLDRNDALAAVTAVPAKALGIEDRVGSIATGRDADLLLFDGDPLDPTSRLRRIWHKGRPITSSNTNAASTKNNQETPR